MQYTDEATFEVVFAVIQVNKLAEALGVKVQGHGIDGEVPADEVIFEAARLNGG